MKILVTGNGFDIANGLPTAYQDFIKTLNLLSTIKEGELNGIYGSYFSLNEGLIEDEIFDVSEIICLKNKLANTWYQYFSDQLEIDTWIDFETKLESTILLMGQFVDFFKKEIFNKDQHYSLMFDTARHFGNNSTRIQLLETFKIINVPQEYDRDNFILNADYCKFNRKAESYSGFNEDVFFKFLLNEWNKFTELFNDYIRVFVNPLIDRIEVSKRINVNKHFTFNYTNTYTKVLDQSVESKHLHGKISNTNSIVLGFDHTDKNKLSKNVIPFTKGFQRLNKDSDFKFIKHIKERTNSIITVYFLGHSLDISDKRYLDEVFELIDGKMEDKKGELKIFYHSSKDKLLNNLCFIYGIDRIEKLCAEGKIIFLKSTPDILESELNFIKPTTNYKIIQNL